MLLRAHQGAGAANLKVAHGNAHAAAQVLVLVYGHQTVRRLRRQRKLPREHEVRVRLRPAASHATLQLVQLRQTQALRVLYYQRVGVRVVDSALDDGRGHQHVNLVLVKLQHHVLYLLRAHLAVRHAHAGLRRRLAHAVHGVVYGRHAVAHVVHLAAARQLRADGGRDHVRVPLPHLHLHGKPPGRRRHDQAHVAHAAHGHLHGARDGRGRKRQHVHLLAHVLQLLLVLHAKALLLVYHHQAQVVRVHVRAQQAVRANEHVHRAVRKAGERLALLCGRHKAAQHPHVQIKGREALEERLVVLLRKDRGGAQHHHLPAVLAALEGGAQRHLRLAKAHVAAEQPVHGLGRFHVRLDVLYGGALVRRQLVRKARLHVRLRRRVRSKRVPLHRGAPGVQVNQVKRELLGRAPGLPRRARPVRRVQARQARARPVRPHVARDAVHLLQRHKQLVLAGVLQQKVVALASGHLLPHDGAKQRDAVRGVHHVVARLEREGHARGVHLAHAVLVPRHAGRQVAHAKHG